MATAVMSYRAEADIYCSLNPEDFKWSDHIVWQFDKNSNLINSGQVWIVEKRPAEPESAFTSIRPEDEPEAEGDRFRGLRIQYARENWGVTLTAYDLDDLENPRSAYHKNLDGLCRYLDGINSFGTSTWERKIEQLGGECEFDDYYADFDFLGEQYDDEEYYEQWGLDEMNEIYSTLCETGIEEETTLVEPEAIEIVDAEAESLPTQGDKPVEPVESPTRPDSPDEYWRKDTFLACSKLAKKVEKKLSAAKHTVAKVLKSISPKKVARSLKEARR
ncbi:uncharacterized protein BCR38DRAFT_414756 [Pseudomassariella vexata]|uniref:Uncharacterized protein n=1 Tax=Pseudomassariella vexata TaxID=1141098 RepID=A0A1Y2D9P6_9PEZI|nr:uncharacterized protein BCR38DRAFT_414756 [Pseudomassariella vexata]ORY55904.1 hypothetical protein BCR38DRAFT_414756 [Pseudomassariella vexata]